MLRRDPILLLAKAVLIELNYRESPLRQTQKPKNCFEEVQDRQYFPWAKKGCKALGCKTWKRTQQEFANKLTQDLQKFAKSCHKGPFTNYVYKRRGVGGQKKLTFCKLLYHRKCKRRRVGGQKKTNLVNVVCERPQSTGFLRGPQIFGVIFT